jgi:hypothetical protein
MTRCRRTSVSPKPGLTQRRTLSNQGQASPLHPFKQQYPSPSSPLEHEEGTRRHVQRPLHPLPCTACAMLTGYHPAARMAPRWPLSLLNPRIKSARPAMPMLEIPTLPVAPRRPHPERHQPQMSGLSRSFVSMGTARSSHRLIAGFSCINPNQPLSQYSDQGVRTGGVACLLRSASNI